MEDETIADSGKPKADQNVFDESDAVAEDISPQQYQERFDPRRHQAYASLYIGAGIVAIFALSLIGMLTAAFLMLWRLEALKQEQAEQFVTKVAIPLVTAIGTFESTLFGPLLAFILGFYFKSTQENR